MSYRGRHRQSAYSVRIMISLATSLLLVGLLFNLPLSFLPQPVGWRLPGRFSISARDFHDTGQDAGFGIPVMLAPGGGPTTMLPAHDSVSARPEVVEHPDSPDTLTREPMLHKIGYMPVLDFAEIMPQVRGGLAAYYIHIEYPEEAKRRGIEGRLVLGFVVEPDGTTSGVHVMDSLHPLCDSAAVRALRRTTFIPGQHHGKARRIRMRLPVRFMLVEADSTVSQEPAPQTPGGPPVKTARRPPV